MAQVFLTGITLDDLLTQLGQIIDTKLQEASSQNHEKQNLCKFISRQEVSKLLKISLPTLNEYTKLGWLQSYKLGNRVLYKQNEIEEAIDKVATYKFKKGVNHAA